MELPALLELLYSASERSRTVRATVHRRHDHARERALLRARGLYRDPPPIPPEEGSWGETAEVLETTTRLWAARPDRFRWESTFRGSIMGGRTSVGVKAGGLFWQRLGDGEVQTNEGRQGSGTLSTVEERLLDPSPLLGVYRLEPRAPITRLGRRGRQVSAQRRFAFGDRAFGPLDEDLALVVDEERGVLLRAAVVVEGEEVSFCEVTEIAFDEPVPPELFQPLR
jgi:hypothetical protein